MRIALTGESDVRIEVANRGLPIDPIGSGFRSLRFYGNCLNGGLTLRRERVLHLGGWHLCTVPPWTVPSSSATCKPRRIAYRTANKRLLTSAISFRR